MTPTIDWDETVFVSGVSLIRDTDVVAMMIDKGYDVYTMSLAKEFTDHHFESNFCTRDHTGFFCQVADRLRKHNNNRLDFIVVDWVYIPLNAWALSYFCEHKWTNLARLAHPLVLNDNARLLVPLHFNATEWLFEKEKLKVLLDAYRGHARLLTMSQLKRDPALHPLWECTDNDELFEPYVQDHLYSTSVGIQYLNKNTKKNLVSTSDIRKIQTTPLWQTIQRVSEPLQSDSDWYTFLEVTYTVNPALQSESVEGRCAGGRRPWSAMSSEAPPSSQTTLTSKRRKAE